MNHFPFCVDFILKIEGGYVNHPLDAGGPTNFGITMRMLQAYRGVVVNEKDVQNLSVDEAKNIYLTYFWNPVRLDKVPSKEVALVLFAHVVHTGQVSAVKALQKTLNVNFNQNLFIDGVFGSRTQVVLSQVKDQKTLARKLIQNIQIYYVEICEARRDQLVFLRGWLNRSFHLCDAIA